MIESYSKNANIDFTSSLFITVLALNAEQRFHRCRVIEKNTVARNRWIPPQHAYCMSIEDSTVSIMKTVLRP